MCFKLILNNYRDPINGKVPEIETPETRINIAQERKFSELAASDKELNNKANLQFA